MTENRADDIRDAESDVDGWDRIRIGACMPYVHREMLDPRMVFVSATVIAVAALALSVFGPVGISDNLDALRRLAFVGTCFLLCWPLCHSLSAALLSLVRTRPPGQIMLACTAGVLFATVPCTAITCTVYWMFEPSVAAHVGIANVYLNVAVAVGTCSLLVHYAACLRVKLRLAGEAAAAEAGSMATVATFGAPAAAAAASRQGRTPPVSSPSGHPDSGHALTDPDADDEAPRRAVHEPAAARQARFLDRLPDTGSRDVVYLHVNGHYINVVTTTGSHMILMRFADAVAELGDMGLQVHRSYWVALRHVTGAQRRDERTVLHLTGDHEVPVSRTHLAAVRAVVSLPSRQHDSPPPGRSAGG